MPALVVIINDLYTKSSFSYFIVLLYWLPDLFIILIFYLILFLVHLKISIPLTGSLLEKLETSEDKQNIKPVSRTSLSQPSIPAPHCAVNYVATSDQETDNDDISAFAGNDDSSDEYQPEKNKKRKRLISLS